MSEQIGIAAAESFLNTLTNATTSVLMLDYDGTLAPFQIDRERAYPYPGILPLLQEILRSSNTRIIIVTGRPIHEVQALLQPLSGIEIWGAHGLDHLLAGGTREQVEIDPELSEFLEQAEEKIRTRGLSRLIEVKPGGVAVHWRGLSEGVIEKVQSETFEEWTNLAAHPGLKLLQFEGGLELRITRPDKGDAIATVLKKLDTNTPVAFLGDDLTDEDGFRVLADRGLSVLVRDQFRDTSAKAWLKPPDELLKFLEQWLSRTRTNPVH
jgi:trehalose-phosphatase